jgi:hypothetical protein
MSAAGRKDIPASIAIAIEFSPDPVSAIATTVWRLF